MRKREIVLIPLEPNALEVYLLALCAFSGARGLLGPTSTGVATPGWAQTLWYGVLLGGGVLGLVGNGWRDRVTGMLILRLALFVVGCGALAQAVLLLRPHHGDAASAVVVVWFAVATMHRTWRLSRYAHTKPPGSE